MGQALSTGQIAETFGVTARAVRFYEERGLVACTRDRLNRRWFDDRARFRLQFIAQMRRIGLSLAEIEGIFRLQEAGGVQDDLNAIALETLHRRLAKLDKQRTAIAAAIAAATQRCAADGAEPIALNGRRRA